MLLLKDYDPKNPHETVTESISELFEQFRTSSRLNTDAMKTWIEQSADRLWTLGGNHRYINSDFELLQPPFTPSFSADVF